MGAAEAISGTMWYVLAAVWNVSFAVLAIGGAAVWRRRVGAERERCRGCGYDLRGLRAREGAGESAEALCPECGQRAV